ncbi:MAG: alpha/beta hydrolase [Acidobacteria bacterium]|nr:alpha/beta hydrolase [Acidobacteriota bacterium]
MLENGLPAVKPQQRTPRHCRRDTAVSHRHSLFRILEKESWRRMLRVLRVLLATGICAGVAQAQTPSAGLAEVNGTKLYYEMAGSGHPLVLIHGGGVDRRLWDGQFEEFAKHFRVIRYDLRGTGKSEVPQTKYSNGEDLRALLQYLKADKAYLLGLSRGGGVAFDLAVNHPEMVGALILVSSNLSSLPQVYHEMISSAAKAGREEGIARAAEIWSSDPYQGPVRPASERIAEVRVPTLVIAGERDAEQARANYDRWARGIPGAKKVVVPGAAHLVNIDQPREFVRIVLEFLKSL